MEGTAAEVWWRGICPVPRIWYPECDTEDSDQLPLYMIFYLCFFEICRGKVLLGLLCHLMSFKGDWCCCEALHELWLTAWSYPNSPLTNAVTPCVVSTGGGDRCNNLFRVSELQISWSNWAQVASHFHPAQLNLCTRNGPCPWKFLSHFWLECQSFLKWDVVWGQAWIHRGGKWEVLGVRRCSCFTFPSSSHSICSQRCAGPSFPSSTISFM